MTLNLAVLLEESANAYPDKKALILGEREMSYAELRGAAGNLARGLAALGVKPGDKVAMMLPNVPQFAAAYYGILSLGAVVVPLNVLLKEREIAYYLEDSDAVALIVWEDFLDEARKGLDRVTGRRQLVVVDVADGEFQHNRRSFDRLVSEHSAEPDTFQSMPDDTAVILYTSGTTGKPKGAELTHFNAFFNAAYFADHLMHFSKDDVGLGALPLFHTFGQTCVMNALLYKGACVALIPRFEPEAALKAIQDAKVTVFAGVPTMYQYFLRHPALDRYDCSSLRLGISGGSSMPVEVLRAFENKLEVTILEGYGLSETSPVAAFNRSADVRKVGSIGLSIWGTEVEVVDSNDEEVPRGERGELVIRGHNVMKGYYKRPEATTQAMRGGWFHTGDAATIDEEGFIYIVDRIKDVILRGGYNVYPREIEEILYEHPAVAECAVIGTPHEDLGEEIQAVLVLKDGETVTRQEIMLFVKERVAAFKYPRQVAFVDELPKTATGKILKRELSAQTEEQLSRSVSS